MAKRNATVGITTSQDFYHINISVEGMPQTLFDWRGLNALVIRQATALGFVNTIRDSIAGMQKAGNTPQQIDMAIKRRLATLRAGTWKADDISGNWADFVAAMVIVLAADGKSLSAEAVNARLGEMKPEQIRAFRARPDVDKEMKRMVAERAAEAAANVDKATLAALDAFA